MLNRCVVICALSLLWALSGRAEAEGIRLDPSSPGLLLDLLPAQEEEAEPDTSEPVVGAPQENRPYATQGSVAWWVELGGGSNFDRGWMVMGGVGVEWYPVDGFALGVRLDGIGVNLSDTPTTGGVGAAILLRWHFLRRDTWSLYFDGGCGLAYFADSVPRGAAQLNFTPQCGVGMSYALDTDIRLLTGVRWYHISNAQTASSNPGVDMLELYVGAAFTF